VPESPARKLGDVVELVTGGTPRTTEAAYWGGEIVWVTPTDVTSLRTPIIEASARTLTQAGVDASAARVLPEGCVVVSARGTVGTAAIAGRPLATNQSMFALVPGKEISGRWLYYWVQANRGEFLARSAGNTFSAISARRAAEIPIIVPPLSRQRRVADLMSSLDAVVTRSRETVESGHRLLHAMTEQLVGTTSWERVILSEVAEVRSGLAKGRKGAEVTSPQPFLRAANVQDGFLALDEIKAIEATDTEAAKFALKDGDVLLIEGGNAEHVGRGWIWEDQVPGILHQNHVFAARVSRSDVLARFVAYAITTKEARAYCLSRARQTANLASINKTQISGLPVPLPSLEEQFRVVRMLDAVRDANDAVHATAEGARGLRDRMGSGLFSGELVTLA
jgi:type I restriction enzyme S subunit